MNPFISPGIPLLAVICGPRAHHLSADDFSYFFRSTTFGISRCLHLGVGEQVGCILRPNKKTATALRLMATSLTRRKDYGRTSGAELNYFMSIYVATKTFQN